MSFDDLPDEIILRIFSFLPEKDLCINCSLVCWKWHNLSSDKSLIKARTRIQNGDDLITIFEDICYNSDYLSFDYFTDYISKSYHMLNVKIERLWRSGWLKGVQNKDLRIVKRIDGYGIPHPISRSYCDHFLCYVVRHGDLPLVKFSTANYQSYTNHGFNHAILTARDNQNLDIAEYLETLKCDS